MKKFIALGIFLLGCLGLQISPARAASIPPIMQRIKVVTVDGDLDEWSDVPVIRTGKSEHSSTPLQWKGAADASFNLSYGWNETGLYVAARIFDESLRDGDLLQLFLTSHPRDTVPLARDTLKINLSPPTADRAVSFKFLSKVQDAAQGKRVKVASKMAVGGYTIEAFVPLELLPGFVSVQESTISALLSFTDADQGRVYPQKVSRALDDSTSGQLIRFALGGSTPAPPGLSEFKLYTNIFHPDPLLDSRLPISVEAAPQLFASDASLRVEVLNGEKIVTSQVVPRASFQAADGLLRTALDLDLANLPDADYQLAFSWQSSVQGAAPRIVKPFALLAQSKQLADQTIDKLAEVNLSALAEKEPFKASAYFGIVAAVEWLKWGLEQKATHAIREATEEIHSRFAALEGGALPSADSMYSLLELTRNPEAQMVVEYMRERTPLYPQLASLSIYWGGMPLVSGLADTYRTEKEVADRRDKITDAISRPSFMIGTTTIYDLPQTLREPLDLAQYQPGGQMFLPVGRAGFEAVAFDEVALRRPDGIWVFPGTDEALVAKIKAAAAKMKIPLANKSELRLLKKVIYAGTPDDSTPGNNIKKAKLFTVKVSPLTGSLYFAKNTTLFRLPYVSLEAAKKFATLILAGQPVTTPDAELIRQDIIQATGRQPQELVVPAGWEVYSGDLHTHSFLSDGRPTPLTVTAQAIYCGLDLHVLSDHGVTQGGLDFADHLKKFHLNYPLTIGTELNTRWGHVNIYPMKRESTYVMGPTIEDVIKTAHQHNATIQWNHPDTGYSHMPDLLENGLEGSGFDAWEHYPPHYSRWKKEGRLPTLTGGSDSHNGTFHLSEVSFLFMPNADGQTLADTVKAGNVILLDPWNGSYTITRNMVNKSHWDDLYFYGPDDKIQFAVNVLADPTYLKTLKEKLLRAYMKDVDIKGLINSSSPYDTVK